MKGNDSNFVFAQIFNFLTKMLTLDLEKDGLESYARYRKTCVKWVLSKRPKIGFQYQLSLNAGQNYCRMLQWEHSAILLTYIKLPFVIKIFVLSIFEWPFNTSFTVV